MHRSVDAWIVVAVSDAAVVHRWRLEAERNMRAQGKPGMSDEEVK
jgi:D-glycerate 3-kinase